MVSQETERHVRLGRNMTLEVWMFFVFSKAKRRPTGDKPTLRLLQGPQEDLFGEMVPLFPTGGGALSIGRNWTGVYFRLPRPN